MFRDYISADFADFHAEMWDWVWSLEPGHVPRPFVSIWFRGAAKSTSAEMAVVAAGRRRTRRFVLYVSGTQEQADTHVQNIAAMLESPEVEADDPALSRRQVTKYGHSRGWRRNRLMTESGLIVDALGLDVNVRGIKIDEHRPDLIIIDDVDNERDTPEATQKKIDRLTRAILPAGSDDVAVLAVQNLVISDGVFARLAEEPGETERSADFLTDRQVSGPIPAISGFAYEIVDGHVEITAGTPTWAGMDLEACVREIETIGLLAFLIECQHEVMARGAQIMLSDWWDGQNRYDALNAPAPLFRVMSWDTAETLSAGSSYSACAVGDVVQWEGRYALAIRDVWRGKVEFHELLDVITERARRWFGDGALQEIWIEEASNGRAAISQLNAQAESWMPRVQGYRTKGQSKDERARRAARSAFQGRVLLPHPDPSVPWLAAFERELYDLPNSAFRDQADAFAQLILTPTVSGYILPDFGSA